jgi:protease II
MNSALSSDSSAAEPLREMIHGVQVEDPFRWLEDQKAPATRAFIHSEQSTYRTYLDQHSELRANKQRRVKELLAVEAVDLPISDRRGGLLYLKRSAEEEQKVIYLRDWANSERRLFSVERLGRDLFTSLSIIQVSPDGRYIEDSECRSRAHGLRVLVGARRIATGSTVRHIRLLARGVDLPVKALGEQRRG